MLDEWKAREEICFVGRQLYEKNFVAANDGNISVRIGRGRYLCTPTLVSKGFMKPADIALVDDNGRQLAGPKPRTSEIMLHLEIYHALPEINAVVHAHPPHATAFAITGVPVPSAILPEVEIFIGQVPLAPYDTPGSKDFAETILPHLRNKANTILLANHGAVTCDKSLMQAYFHLEILDQYCRILLLGRDIGQIRQLPEGKVQDLLKIKQRLGFDDPRLSAAGEPCRLGGSDDFLRGFSQQAIPQHQAQANGAGRGRGIADSPSQAGQPQPVTAGTIAKAASAIPLRYSYAGQVHAGLGASSRTAQQRALDDEVERLTQLITDRIVEMYGKT
jgi:L-fuculose-phosphate aldolase